MQVTVDTEKDSPENIRKVIALLQGFVEKTESQAASVFSPDLATFSSADSEQKKEEEPVVEEKKDLFGNFLHRKSSKKKKDDDDDGSIGIKIIPY